MAYVGMTRGKDDNHAYIYQRSTEEGDHHHSRLVAESQNERLHRGTVCTAAQYFRTILANNDRPRTMHTEAEHAARGLLPQVVANLLDSNDQRRHQRTVEWQRRTAAACACERAYERILINTRGGVERTRDMSEANVGHALEL